MQEMVIPARYLSRQVAGFIVSVPQTLLHTKHLLLLKDNRQYNMLGTVLAAIQFRTGF